MAATPDTVFENHVGQTTLREPTERHEIEHRTIKLIVGIIALSLASLTNLFANSSLRSISESYHHGGWSQTIFIGFLFAIAAFLMAYNGFTKGEMVASKIAALAALGVALVPCAYEGTTTVPYIHWISAAIMFLVLAYFCYTFFKRARGKTLNALLPNPQAGIRASVYVICGIVIVFAIALLAIDGLFGHFLSEKVNRLVFYGEAAALIAFGISWLTASRVLPIITRDDERLSFRGKGRSPR